MLLNIASRHRRCGASLSTCCAISLFAVSLLASKTQAQPKEHVQEHVQEHVVKSVEGVYRTLAERLGPFEAWIVDGARIRLEVYPEFVYGGNGERYRYVPANEIWLDQAISAEEYRYTLAHELEERKLMAKQALTYFDAHDSALMLENRMRLADSLESAEHERTLASVRPIDDDSVKELSWLPDSLRLHGVYLQHLENEGGLQVWLVNGAAVRREIYPDFGFSGNDLAYYFIPHHEIWIDNAISCEETNYSITLEMRERELMQQGAIYDSAYTSALRYVTAYRSGMYRDAANHPPVRVPDPPDRDVGTGSEGVAAKTYDHDR